MRSGDAPLAGAHPGAPGLQDGFERVDGRAGRPELVEGPTLSVWLTGIGISRRRSLSNQGDRV